MKADDLINNSGIWSKVGKIIVGEMCLKDLRNEGNLRHVPKLEEDSEEFYPLKIIQGIGTNHKNQSLSKRHTKFLKESEGKRPGRLSSNLLRKSREIRDVHVAQICEERILEEVIHPAEFHPCLRIFQRVHHSPQPSSVSDHGLAREVTINVDNIKVRHIDPRGLLWCRLDVGDGQKSRLLRVIYETHVAEKLSLIFKVSSHHPHQDQKQDDRSFDLTIKDCALAYRFVDLELSKEGVVTDVHFRVASDLSEEKSRFLGTFFSGLRERLRERVRPAHFIGSSESLSECVDNEAGVLLPSLLSRNEQIMKILNIHQEKQPLE